MLFSETSANSHPLIPTFPSYCAPQNNSPLQDFTFDDAPARTKTDPSTPSPQVQCVSSTATLSNPPSDTKILPDDITDFPSARPLNEQTDDSEEDHPNDNTKGLVQIDFRIEDSTDSTNDDVTSSSSSIESSLTPHNDHLCVTTPDAIVFHSHRPVTGRDSSSPPPEAASSPPQPQVTKPFASKSEYLQSLLHNTDSQHSHGINSAVPPLATTNRLSQSASSRPMMHYFKKDLHPSSDWKVNSSQPRDYSFTHPFNNSIKSDCIRYLDIQQQVNCNKFLETFSSSFEVDLEEDLEESDPELVFQVHKAKHYDPNFLDLDMLSLLSEEGVDPSMSSSSDSLNQTASDSETTNNDHVTSNKDVSFDQYSLETNAAPRLESENLSSLKDLPPISAGFAEGEADFLTQYNNPSSFSISPVLRVPTPPVDEGETSPSEYNSGPSETCAAQSFPEGSSFLSLPGLHVHVGYPESAVDSLSTY